MIDVEVNIALPKTKYKPSEWAIELAMAEFGVTHEEACRMLLEAKEDKVAPGNAIECINVSNELKY